MRFIVSLNLIGLVVVFMACGWQKGANKGTPATTQITTGSVKASVGEWVQVGSIKFKVSSVKRGYVSGITEIGKQFISSSKPHLSIYLEIENTDPTKIINIHSVKKHAEMKDNFDNELLPVTLYDRNEDRVLIEGQFLGSRRIRYPETSSQPITDLVVFELPPPAATEVLLKISAEAFGGSPIDATVIVIPQSEWSPKK